MAHQSLRGIGGFLRTKMFSQAQERHYSAAKIGQHIYCLIREQVGKDSVPQTEQHFKGPVAVVHEITLRAEVMILSI